MVNKPCFILRTLFAVAWACAVGSMAAASCSGVRQLERLETLLTGLIAAEHHLVTHSMARAILAYELPTTGDVASQFRPALRRLHRSLAAYEASHLTDPDPTALKAEATALRNALTTSGCRTIAPPPPLPSAIGTWTLQIPRFVAEARAWQNTRTAPPWPILFLGAVGLGLLAWGARLTYRHIELRHARRHHFPTPVIVTSHPNGQTWTGTSLDISRIGMKLSGQPAPGVGTRLSLEFSNIKVEAVVRWSNTFYYGVDFKQAFSNSAVRSLIESNAQHMVEQTKTAPRTGAAV